MIQGVLRLNQASGPLCHQPPERMPRAMYPRVLDACFLTVSLQVLGEGVGAERRSTLARPVKVKNDSTAVRLSRGRASGL